MVQYLLSVVSAAIICAVIVSLFEKNSTVNSMVKLLSGLFLAITVISPFLDLNIPSISIFEENIQDECQRLVASGKNVTSEERQTIISEQIEAYIGDEAVALGVDAEIIVQLSDAEPPVPCSVVLEGAFSPYARTTLEQIIERELGIPKEQQIWK